MKKFRPQYVLLADQVQEVKDGKINILGIFENIFLGEEPSEENPRIFQGFAVVASIAALQEDALGAHNVEIRIVRPNKQIGGQAGGQIHIKPVGGPYLATFRIVLRLQGVAFREYGRHRVVVLVDGEEVGDQYFMVGPRKSSE